MMRIAITNRCQENMCYNEIGLCAQIVVSILGSMVNIMGRTYVVIFIKFKNKVFNKILHVDWPLISRLISTLI